MKQGYSIIIPVFNGEKTLPDTLRSVNGIQYDSFEIIVVDDASTDNSCAIAQQSGAKVIKLERNSGPATARNRGAEDAGFEILLFTDSDVLVSKHILRQLDSSFKKSKADAIQGTFSEVCPYANYFSQYKNLYNRFALNQLPEWIDTTFTSVTAVKKQAFMQSGGFDSNIRTASVEDRTLGRNLRKHGYSIYLDKSIEVIHNKQLTFIGFIKNQFRRSKDLVKLLARNRAEPTSKSESAVGSFDESGRYGTNSFSTMARIPVAYSILFCLLLSFIDSIFVLIAGLFSILFLFLIFNFEFELLRKKGIQFAAVSIAINFLDACISGLGILAGIVDFFIFHRRY